jgi:carbonic anhydrase
MAAMDDKDHGLIDNWLRHIRDVDRFNAKVLEGLSKQERLDALCELNVKEQVTNVCNTSVVKKAWKEGQHLHIHGWIYNISNGLLKDLGTFES